MKRSITTILLLALAALIVFAGARQILKSRAELPKSISQLQKEQGVPVEVEQACTDTFKVSRTFLGTVEGGLQGDVLAPIMEKIVEIPVQVGDRVKVGQVVARLDARAAQAQYSQLKLAYEDAEREAKRMENLFAAGAVSEQMLQKAQLGRDMAKRNLESSSELVALTAPISGVVTDIFRRQGETTEIGKPVARIANLSRIKVEFKVNYDDRRLITAETPAFIRISGNGVQEIPARIADIGLSADPNTRLFSIWLTSENGAELLQPGLLVDVRLDVIRKPNALLVHREAVLTRNDQVGVFIIGDDLRATFKPLQIGLTNPTHMEVLQGLSSGQRVVIYGQNNLSDGQLVNIIKS